MRKIFAILLVGLLAGVCVAAPKSTLTAAAPLVITDISTGAVTQSVDSVTGPAKLRGYVEAIYIQITGVNTSDVDIVSTNVVNAEWPERVLYSIDNTEANWITVYPRADENAIVSGAGLTNQSTRIPLFNEKLILRAHGATATNSNIKAFVLYSKE